MREESTSSGTKFIPLSKLFRNAPIALFCDLIIFVWVCNLGGYVEIVKGGIRQKAAMYAP